MTASIKTPPPRWHSRRRPTGQNWRYPMRRIAVIALLVICFACNRKPAESTASTDTIQSTPSSTSGTTATETGGGPPVKSDTSATGNAAGSGSTGTSGTMPGGTTTVSTTTSATSTTGTHR